MYDIEFTSEAIEDLKSFRKFEQQPIISGIDSQLKYEPTVETRNRFRMRPNVLLNGSYELASFEYFTMLSRMSKLSALRLSVSKKAISYLFEVRGGIYENRNNSSRTEVFF